MKRLILFFLIIFTLSSESQKVALIDLSHVSEETSNTINSKDKDLVLFKEILEQYNYKVEWNFLGELNEERLEGVSILYIVVPELPFTKTEKRAIREWVEQGGNLFVTAETPEYWYYNTANSFESWSEMKFLKILPVDFENHGVREEGKSELYPICIPDKSHPISEGVREIWHVRGAALEVTGIGVSVFKTLSTSFDKLSEKKGPFTVVGANTYGKGKIVFAADMTILTVEGSGGEVWVRNMIEWFGMDLEVEEGNRARILFNDLEEEIEDAIDLGAEKYASDFLEEAIYFLEEAKKYYKNGDFESSKAFSLKGIGKAEKAKNFSEETMKRQKEKSRFLIILNVVFLFFIVILISFKYVKQK